MTIGCCQFAAVARDDEFSDISLNRAGLCCFRDCNLSYYQRTIFGALYLCL